MQGVDKTPSKFREFRDSWLDLNREDTVVEWDEEAIILLIEIKYKQFLQFYKALDKLISRADVGRAFILDAFGGVYVDMDACCLQPVSALYAFAKVDIASQHIILGRSSHAFFGAINNAVIACSRGHPFWMTQYLPYVRQQVERGYVYPEALIPALYILRTTGPTAYKNLVKAGIEGLKLLEYKVMYGEGEWGASELSKDIRASYVEKGAFVYHASQGSWFEGVSKVAFVAYKKYARLAVMTILLIFTMLSASFLRAGVLHARLETIKRDV